MRRIETLIKLIRQHTDNSNTNTMTNDVIANFINDAQDRLQSLIYQTKPESNPFNTVGFIEFVTNVDEYSLLTMKDVNGNTFTSHMLAGQAISLVERTDNPLTSSDSYFPLKLISNKERVSGYGYYLRDTNIIITPKPDTGVLRITYPKRLPALDIRRGKISATTPGASFTLGAGTVPTGTDFDTIDYVTIIDFDGNIVRENVKITAYDSATRVATTTDLLTDVTTDHYVCYGKYSTSHSSLDESTERYLREYAALRIFMMDSSKDSSAQANLVQSLENDISGLFADNMNDVQHIPIVNTDYMML